ncbi:hypothetical protein PHB09_142 [Pseudomonas phage PHB09]|uniref:Uncharacterized protein n=1 Tax=Pseudomonas phage PHB09 TaxID=2867265 RepID=A0AAE8XD89_9CAUD|nr:hypothetical protein QGX10_gp141 [Pseudomonas phage PHB09]UAV84637.1 hypothetical protein PHB09_142 [Pseudomonas phage PHB09]
MGYGGLYHCVLQAIKPSRKLYKSDLLSNEKVNTMRTVKAQEFVKPYEYEAAKKQARRQEIGRRSGRRGTPAWGVWAESEQGV